MCIRDHYQVAKSVGSTLRSFQPTIKEVVSVGQDLKSTLDKELGLDDLREAARPLPRVPGECSTPATAIDDPVVIIKPAFRMVSGLRLFLRLHVA